MTVSSGTIVFEPANESTRERGQAIGGSKGYVCAGVIEGMKELREVRLERLEQIVDAFTGGMRIDPRGPLSA